MGTGLKLTASLNMNKLCLIFLGVLALAAIAAAFDNEEDSNLSEELASSRLVRSAVRKGVRKTRGKPRKAIKRTKKSSGKGKKPRKGVKKTMKKGTKTQKKGPKKVKKSKGTRTSKGTKKTQSVSKMSGRAVSDTCFGQAMTVMRMWKDIIANFDKQNNRMGKQLDTMASKAGKSGIFAPIALRLIETGGGDKAALTCAGSADNDGAAQLLNLTDTLGACGDTVMTSCDSTNMTGLANATLLAECVNITTDFKMAAEECLMMSVGVNKTDTDTACACWSGEELAAIAEAAKVCKFPTEAKNVAKLLKTCVTSFGECRKYEDDAITIMAACSSDASTLTSKAAALSANSDAVADAQAKVAELAASAGRRVRRSGREEETCTSVTTLATTLTALVISSPASPDVLVLSTQISATTVTVCTEEEAAALTELDAAFEDAVSTLVEAFDAVQEQLESLTGTTASAAVISAATQPPTEPSVTEAMF